VLWVLALLSFLLVGFAGDARTEFLLARNQYETAHARAIADAGVTMAVVGVLDTSPDTTWPADGTERELSYDGGTLRVRVQDEGGKVDLNTAPPEVLLNLMRVLGTPNDQAESVIQSFVDWRTRHQPAPVQNGQILQTLNAPTGAFAAIEEFRLVPGVTRELYDRVLPFITIYSGLPDIDQLTAPEPVLLSLPGMSASQVENFIAERQQAAGNLDAITALSGAGVLARRPVRSATVTSEGRTAAGVTFTREAVVAITREPASPFHLLAWRQGRRAEPPPMAAASR
jgi:general secretion pathway protein K